MPTPTFAETQACGLRVTDAEGHWLAAGTLHVQVGTGMLYADPITLLVVRDGRLGSFIYLTVMGLNVPCRSPAAGVFVKRGETITLQWPERRVAALEGVAR